MTSQKVMCDVTGSQTTGSYVEILVIKELSNKLCDAKTTDFTHLKSQQLQVYKSETHKQPGYK